MVTLRPAEGPAALSGVEQAAISYQASVDRVPRGVASPRSQRPRGGMAGYERPAPTLDRRCHQGQLCARTSSLRAEAFTTWSNSLAGVLAQISVVDPDAADQLLGSMTDFSAFQGGLAGLESPFLSAYLASGQGGEITPNMQQAADLVGQVGLPRVLGGGAATSPILDSMMQSLTFADHDQLDEVSAARSGRELLQNLKDLTTSERTKRHGLGADGLGADRLRANGQQRGKQSAHGLRHHDGDPVSRPQR